MRCEICGDKLLPGLVNVGIKTCLKCRGGAKVSKTSKGTSSTVHDWWSAGNDAKNGYINGVGGYN